MFQIIDKLFVKMSERLEEKYSKSGIQVNKKQVQDKSNSDYEETLHN